ncbi:MAG: bifunctional DNA-formamidopyrimidine glycosylase/DNA-(apurinic or apyrimidinic site) lyase [Candidatus Saganbacteria bacterium]|nr:bifunctional DNA-formamidopyrimidine glycosylase/DNA-(apurinic or apyrimidinic site) lyase [Candidatus Saganbacteria bacterium]
MPELPEVETIKRGLAKNIVGKRISGFAADVPKMLNRPAAAYRKTVAGKKITGIGRRAKMLIVDLDGGWRLWFHLKMTGQLVFSGGKKKVVGGHPIREGFEQDPNRFTRATFEFSDGSHLFFNDVRKFGWVRLYRDRELAGRLEAMKLGPEPLSPEFTLPFFRKSLQRRPNNKIKAFLMDPRNVVGLGNIYSDEVCFYARVRPDRRVKTLKDNEIKLLFQGIRKILAEAIKYEGTSFSDYVNALGEAGAYTKKLKVYQRYGLKCCRCRGKVSRMKFGGRTSHFCPSCQR